MGESKSRISETSSFSITRVGRAKNFLLLVYRPIHCVLKSVLSQDFISTTLKIEAAEEVLDPILTRLIWREGFIDYVSY
jgi:hypothetical protein